MRATLEKIIKEVEQLSREEKWQVWEHLQTHFKSMVVHTPKKNPMKFVEKWCGTLSEISSTQTSDPRLQRILSKHA